VFAQVKDLYDQQELENDARPAAPLEHGSQPRDHRVALRDMAPAYRGVSLLAAESGKLAAAPTTLGSFVGMVTTALAVDAASVPVNGVLTVENASP